MGQRSPGYEKTWDHGGRPLWGKGKLTLLELRGVQMLADGMSPKQLTGNGKTLRSVQQMMFRIRSKLGAHTTVHMIAQAFRKGLIR